ncbi:M48 family metallopeptidase [Undibacterium sp.]|uniref:M48 family metallopeptidase n=1 Tax=Undibacterium sp. TaxID=1914977 RepID=UPI002CE54E70|nr:M48 family metallopeptidase [Undibacterium sp.]HTD03657.1 M48 family metallopeptidase [Undibacterium sp.]
MSKKLFWLLPLACLILAAIIVAIAPLSQNAAARATAEIAPATDAWRAALPRAPVAATEAYMALISPAAKQRSDAYFEGGYWLQALAFMTTLVSCWAILASGVLVRLRDRLEKRGQRRWLTSLLIFAGFVALSAILSSPLDIYQGYYREHLYGLANQSFGPWFSEAMIALAVNLIGGSLFLLAVYAAIRKLPRTWWIWGAAIGTGFLCLMMLIAPVYIDPLFNTYKPLTDEKIRQPILSMARANGVPADNVYQFDASRQSNRISANVSGIFGTAAVRLNDNLLNRTSLPEIKGVMGHELGHYVLNHVYHFILSFGVILVLGFVFVQRGMAWGLQQWGGRFGIRDQADPVGLPLFIALFAVYLFAMTPVINTVIRSAETEADIFGLNTSQEPDGFAEVDLKLTEYRKSDPGPIEEFLFYDHPSPRKRIYSAMRWKAEHWKSQ